MNPLLSHTAARYGFLALVAVLLFGLIALAGSGFLAFLDRAEFEAAILRRKADRAIQSI